MEAGVGLDPLLRGLDLLLLAYLDKLEALVLPVLLEAEGAGGDLPDGGGGSLPELHLAGSHATPGEEELNFGGYTNTAGTLYFKILLWLTAHQILNCIYAAFSNITIFAAAILDFSAILNYFAWAFIFFS